MAGGKIVRIAGGKIIERYGTLTYYQENFTINAGGPIELTTDGEMIYGEPEEPKAAGIYIIRGWWSSDKEGNNKIREAYLGDTVYFQFETRNIPVYDYKNDDKDEGLSRLKISFYDSQLGWLGIDCIAWDRRLDGAQKYAYVESENRAYATLKFLYNKYTIQLVKEDDTPGDIEVYCKAEYSPKTLKSSFNGGPVYQLAHLPVRFTDYLRVKLPEIPDLYFIRPGIDYQFPEIRSSEGNAIYMELLLNEDTSSQQKIEHAQEKIKAKITDQAKEKVKNEVGKGLEYLKKKTYTLAIRELEKGYLMYTDGSITLRKNVYENKTITMIDGNVHRIKRASDTAFRIAHPTLQGETRYATTKGLNQLEVLAQKNPIHTATQLSTQLFETMGYVIDLQGMEESMASGTPDYKGMGSFLLKKFFGFFPSWVGQLAGQLSLPVALMIEQYSQELEELIKEEAFKTFLKKKEEGMKAMELFLGQDKPNKTLAEEKIIELGFGFLRISTSTLQKLLAKEFDTLEKLNDFEWNLRNKDLLHGVVIRKIKNIDYKRYDYFIYCIFIDDKNLDL
ncbi:hypothetical protein O2K51_14485 [Apibacter raozihei]|uniref:hypothetical protein n=1 Tax=Apibacter raozihei TaxID=2500547 RepID=UPI000FE41B8E|nr:hypothetical protein [Apibacter raozihei]